MESQSFYGSSNEYRHMCSICSQQYSRQQRVPISLNCGHTFCAICVARFQGRGVGAHYKICCGICRAITFAPLREIKKNVLMMDLLDEQGKLASVDLLETGGEIAQIQSNEVDVEEVSDLDDEEYIDEQTGLVISRSDNQRLSHSSLLYLQLHRREFTLIGRDSKRLNYIDQQVRILYDAAVLSSGNANSTANNLEREESSRSMNDTKEYKHMCPVCMQPFSRDSRFPISLNCGHTFCALCVARFQKRGVHVRYKICCGICRAITFAPIQVMKKNELVIDLLEEQGELAESDIFDGDGDLGAQDNDVQDLDEEITFDCLFIDHNHHIERIEENIRVICEIQGLTNFMPSLLYRHFRVHRREFEQHEREWERLYNRLLELSQSLHDAAVLPSGNMTVNNSSNIQGRALD